jgi:perosamine synthetase
MDFIPVAGPWVTQKEIDYVADAAANAWYGNANTYHARFEAAFAKYIGRKYAIAVPHCTSAIHLALLSLGLKPGDEVIVPEITWIATAAPISYLGATPIFADIDPRYWCMDPASFERNITTKTKAVILVDLYGNMPDMDAILSIAERHGVAVIEDAAQAIGAEYKGKKSGSFGYASVFSFHGTKTMTTGEGGMFLTDDESAYQRCYYLSDHGREVGGDKLLWNTEVGYKYKMSALQAAFGMAQLERIGELVERRRQIFAWYKEMLDGVPGIALNQSTPEVRSTYWMVTIVVDKALGIDKEQLIAAMAEKNVGCRPFQYPLSSLPAYAAYADAKPAQSRNVNAYSISPYGINLPSGFNMTQDLVIHVSNCFKEVLAKGPRA